MLEMISGKGPPSRRGNIIMEHPLIPSLEAKTTDELQKVMQELVPKLTFAYRTQNGPLINQLTMALESYRNEYHKKMTKQMDELMGKHSPKIVIEKHQ